MRREYDGQDVLGVEGPLGLARAKPTRPYPTPSLEGVDVHFSGLATAESPLGFGVVGSCAGDRRHRYVASLEEAVVLLKLDQRFVARTAHLQITIRTIEPGVRE